MAEDLNRTGDNFSRAPWLKIFSAFKVALDPKKLLLAGLGILTMSLGWWILSIIFFALGSKPQFSDYEANFDKDIDAKGKQAAYDSFRTARARWDLRFELAGPPTRREAKDLGDYAEKYENFVAARTILDAEKVADKIAIVVSKDSTYQLQVDGKNFDLTGNDDKEAGLAKLPVNTKVATIFVNGDLATIDGATVKVKDAEELKKIVDKSRTAMAEATKSLQDNPERLRILALVELVRRGEYMHGGKLRTWPWFENRGPNPVLLVKSQFGSDPKVADGSLKGWLFGPGIRVVGEPLYKFLLPIVYLFDQRAGGFLNLVYLLSIIVCTLVVWGFFGGAITRIAVVEVARNEKVGFTEAIRFARERLQYFFFAPMLPLLFLFILTALLWGFGLLFNLIPVLGDVFAGILWPAAMLLGMIMAVVLVGLVGWPLMNPTISAEGSDSFDALTRSYSYVFQAPWQYLWYSFLALVYGAVLVFFVGFMGSLLVYLSKWGVNQGSYIQSRDPAFLFVRAPTSFGWRDLLLHDSPHRVVVSNPTIFSGHYALEPAYMADVSWYNHIGIFFVSVWLYFFFLLLVGFGYSFFWTASSIIYLLMRKKIDDTDMDEVHLEEEEPMGFMAEGGNPAMGAAASTMPPSTTPGTSGSPGNLPPASTPPGTTFTMVDAPKLNPSSAPPTGPTPGSEASSPSESAPETPPTEPVPPPEERHSHESNGPGDDEKKDDNPETPPS